MKIKWSPTWQLANELQGIVLIGFSLLIFKLLVKGEMIALVAPKMVPYLFVSMTFMFLLGFFRLLNSNLKGADCDCDVCDENVPPLKLALSYLLFFSPLFLFFTLPDLSINKDLLPNLEYEKGISTLPSIVLKEQSFHQEDSIQVTEENFFQVMDQLNTNLDSMQGKEISMMGFIHREKSFSSEEAVIARNAMTHCIADLSIYGYMIKGDVGALTSEHWYEIVGTIEKQEIDGEVMPVINVQSASNTKEPQEEYIYPLY
ncbi:TIGR03943 family putative permease subunit [Bacillus sp. B1-b2]|uniref:TIGR03943 family putative permease subunit n=1 Tax=Bacillus sp. B1-b2 TaxID=2653201 RepID=UPI0012614960|nr:TIGR03943 family protein [Bacillus sp. B1-b2]KAB7673124.1 TIGR03943 family protein [Bacillus sp. B1-b2]